MHFTSFHTIVHAILIPNGNIVRSLHTLIFNDDAEYRQYWWAGHADDVTNADTVNVAIVGYQRTVKETRGVMSLVCCWRPKWKRLSALLGHVRAPAVYIRIPPAHTHIYTYIYSIVGGCMPTQGNVWLLNNFFSYLFCLPLPWTKHTAAFVHFRWLYECVCVRVRKWFA